MFVPSRTLIAALAATFGPLAAAVAQAPAPDGPAVERRVDSLLGQLTVEEKIRLLGGVNSFDVPGIPRLGIPQLGTSDSPFGVRAGDQSTLYVGGIALAATWDPALAERVGGEIGRDARARGRNYSLGPGVDIYRMPLNGRNFEYFGEDPLLGSRIAVGFITGMQDQGVSATIKHFLGNNSEYARNTTDSRIDERALREIYLPIWEAAVKEAHVGAVMDAYNLTNGAYMTANHRLNVEILKDEWGFDGFIESDYTADEELRACPPVNPATGPCGHGVAADAPSAAALSPHAGPGAHMARPLPAPTSGSCPTPTQTAPRRTRAATRRGRT